MAEDPQVSAAVGPPGQGWHLLSAPVPSAANVLAASEVPADALALPQEDADGGFATVKKGSQSGKPRRRSEGAANGGASAPRPTSLAALVEGEHHV